MQTKSSGHAWMLANGVICRRVSGSGRGFLLARSGSVSILYQRRYRNTSKAVLLRRMLH